MFLRDRVYCICETAKLSNFSKCKPIFDKIVASSPLRADHGTAAAQGTDKKPISPESSGIPESPAQNVSLPQDIYHYHSNFTANDEWNKNKEVTTVESLRRQL